ncbi:hypothetical protein [Desulfamplus magnetovallimortis]|nr:hypothetical protein [Desulfamplus magnetovallimortis]
MGTSSIITIVLLNISFCPDIANSFITLNQYIQNWEFSGFIFKVLRNYIQNYTSSSGSITRSIILILFTLLYSIVFFQFLKNKVLQDKNKDSGFNVLTDALFKIALIWTITTPTLYPWYALYLVALIPFNLKAHLNTTGTVLSWSLILSYKVLILYKITGEWAEMQDIITPLMIIGAPLAALILKTRSVFAVNRHD